eukprot:SAG22_NODE_140_length_17982_cov_81.438741_6_plen_102_part_00
MSYLIAPFKFGFDIGERGGAAAVRTYDIMKHDHNKGLAWGGKAVKQFDSQYKIADPRASFVLIVLIVGFLIYPRVSKHIFEMLNCRRLSGTPADRAVPGHV